MPILVPQIVVSRAAYDSKESWGLMEGNIYFVNKTAAEGLYEPDEYIPDAIGLCHLWSYLGEVTNGGHEQFAANTGWKAETNDHIERILDRIGAFEAAKVFRTVRTRVDGDDELCEGMQRRAGFNDLDDDLEDLDDLETEGDIAWAEEMDQNIWRLNGQNALYRAGSEFLRGHTSLEIVEPKELDARSAAIAASNPYLAQRRADREAAVQRRLKACELLGVLARPTIDARPDNEGRSIQIMTRDRKVPCYVYRSKCGRLLGYVELDGRGILLTYSQLQTIAEIDLSSIPS